MPTDEGGSDTGPGDKWDVGGSAKNVVAMVERADASTAATKAANTAATLRPRRAAGALATLARRAY